MRRVRRAPFNSPFATRFFMPNFAAHATAPPQALSLLRSDRCGSVASGGARSASSVAVGRGVQSGVRDGARKGLGR